MAAKLKLRYENATPPGGAWSYHDPDLDRMFETFSVREDLLQDINRARVANGFEAVPPDELDQKVLRFVCDRAPPGFCKGVNPSKGRRTLTIASITNFTRTLVKIIGARAKGAEIYNPDPTAAAQVCLNCPLNRQEYCSTCTGLESVARLLLRQKQKTPLDPKLGACEACGCMLRVKVHYHPEILRGAVLKADEERYPKDTCWIWKEEKYPKEPDHE